MQPRLCVSVGVHFSWRSCTLSGNLHNNRKPGSEERFSVTLSVCVGKFQQHLCGAHLQFFLIDNLASCCCFVLKKKNFLKVFWNLNLKKFTLFFKHMGPWVIWMSRVTAVLSLSIWSRVLFPDHHHLHYTHPNTHAACLWPHYAGFFGDDTVNWMLDPNLCQRIHAENICRFSYLQFFGSCSPCCVTFHLYLCHRLWFYFLTCSSLIG